MVSPSWPSSEEERHEHCDEAHRGRPAGGAPLGARGGRPAASWWRAAGDAGRAWSPRVLVGLLALTAGAGALTNFSTGVPAVDTLLEIESPERARWVGTGHPAGTGSGRGAAGRFPLGHGTSPRGDLSGPGRQGLPRHRRTGRRGARPAGAGGWRTWHGPSTGARSSGTAWRPGPTTACFDGYADGGVTAIRVAGAGDSITVKLSRPWTAQAAGAEPLRHFVVIDEADIDVGGDGVQMDEANRIVQPFPPLVVTTERRRRRDESRLARPCGTPAPRSRRPDG